MVAATVLIQGLILEFQGKSEAERPTLLGSWAVGGGQRQTV
jgi:hypothetical protein